MYKLMQVLWQQRALKLVAPCSLEQLGHPATSLTDGNPQTTMTKVDQIWKISPWDDPIYKSTIEAPTFFCLT